MSRVTIKETLIIKQIVLILMEMLRKISDRFGSNRWNYSQDDDEWIFIEVTEDGVENYYCQKEPPEEFIELTMKIKELNEKLIITKDNEENTRIFIEMTKITKRLQSMPRCKDFDMISQIEE